MQMVLFKIKYCHYVSMKSKVFFYTAPSYKWADHGERFG